MVENAGNFLYVRCVVLRTASRQANHPRSSLKVDASTSVPLSADASAAAVEKEKRTGVDRGTTTQQKKKVKCALDYVGSSNLKSKTL